MWEIQWETVAAVGRDQGIMRQRQWSGFKAEWDSVKPGRLSTACSVCVYRVFDGCDLQAEFQLLLWFLVCAKNIQFLLSCFVSLFLSSQKRENRCGRQGKRRRRERKFQAWPRMRADGGLVEMLRDRLRTSSASVRINYRLSCDSESNQ